MKIPSKLFIHGQEFTVEFRTEKEMSNELGRCDVNNNCIFIREGINEEKLGEVFLHEVIHAVTEILDMDISEKQVNNIAVGLYPIFRHGKLDLTV